YGRFRLSVVSSATSSCDASQAIVPTPHVAVPPQKNRSDDVTGGRRAPFTVFYPVHRRASFEFLHCGKKFLTSCDTLPLLGFWSGSHRK
ncbi:MAG: hypothetical protein KAT44_15745, partial [Pirellulales bacterium]|nr:hypothetical protein [Pirellulales bacterium]